MTAAVPGAVTYDALEQRILEFISSSLNAEKRERDFNELALAIYRFQHDQNEFYRNYLKAIGAREPRTWREIPPVPASAFKRAKIVSFPEQAIGAWFKTSGTSEAESGQHYFRSLDLYEAAILPNFEAHLLPHKSRLPMLILTPSPDQAPHSSLVHMMHVVGSRLAQSHEYFVSGSEVLVDKFLGQCRKAAERGQPVFLLGTGFAFLHVLDQLTAFGETVKLPPGSRIMETGGFKGRTREVARAEFYGMLSQGFGIPADHIVNEYGMTELSSQFYDASLVRSAATDEKTVSPWSRVLIVNPDNGREVAAGERGLICIIDCANLGSVVALQTEDVGYATEKGFAVLGRVSRAPMRGCSLDAERWRVKSV